jgi:1-acyl-sn-glycerol-3-phosphate acyltransferase
LYFIVDDMAQRSMPKRLWYDFLRITCRLAGTVVFGIRVRGREWVPREGGALVMSNHQSHLDPVLVGLATDRRLNYLARQTLFRFAPFRWLISSLDAIPLDREGLGLSGLKETLRRLKRGEMVLIFPEGTRTRDGEVGKFKPGFCALARRANVPLVPTAIDGAFDSWPRTRPLPLPATIHIQFGSPLTPEEIGQFDDEGLVAEMRRRIAACHAEARRLRDRALGTNSETGCAAGSTDARHC